MVHFKVPGFGKGELWLMIATGCMLFGGVLAAVTTGVTWASFEQSGAELTYGLSEGGFAFGNSHVSVDYSDPNFDDQDGAGLLRAAGPLMIVGIVLTFVAMAALAVSLFVRGAFITLGGSIGAALAVVFLLLALILLPIGIDQNFAENAGQEDVSWGAGLYLGVFGTAFALAGTVLAFLARFDRTADLS